MKLDYLPVIQQMKNGKPLEGCGWIPLPRELWESLGRCSCKHCEGEEGFWDTLSFKIGEVAVMVHHPDLHKGKHK